MNREGGAMRRTFSVLFGVSIAAFTLGACGSSSTTTTTTAPTTTTTTPPSSAGATVATASSPYGTILVTGSGRTLYMLTADSATKSVCSTSCTSVWPPLTVTSVPKFGAGTKASLFGDIVRSDGAHQLTYNGHPLYTYAGDSAKGQQNGEGIASFGGTWFVVAAATGRAITTPHATTTTSPYGY